MNLVVFAVLSFLLAADDPVKTLPDSYKLQFENDWVRIVRVIYPAHSTLRAHDHSQLATAYVYLNDAGPVIFHHVGGNPVTRPPTKAGGFRLFRAVRDERHAVENPGDSASEFLRVELKTEPKEERTLRGRYPPEPGVAGENLERVQFENEQVRITRVICAAGKTVRIATGATEPSLLIAISPAELAITDSSGATSMLTLAVGQEHWLDVNRNDRFENRGTEAAELLRFEFKTPALPASK